MPPSLATVPAHTVSQPPAGPRRLDLRAVAQALAEEPGGSLTMAQIAARVGVAKPTLYRLAGSKAELLRACLDAEAERLLGHLQEGLSGSGSGGATLFERTLRALDEYARDSPGGFALLFERRVAQADVRVRRIEAWTADQVRHDGVAGGRESDLVVAGLLGAAAAIVARARHRGEAVDPASAALELGVAMTAQTD